MTPFSLHTPPFAPLLSLIKDFSQWPPAIETLNALAATRAVTNGAGSPLRFEAAQGRLSALDYERRIAQTGRVATREGDLHDVFNALVWLSFPRMKAALNRLHGGACVGRRSPARDFATLLDESGMLIAYRDAALIDLLRQRAWQRLFVDRREEVIEKLRFFVVGHAIYQKAQQPYPGITAHTLALPMTNAFFDLPLDQAVSEIDLAAAEWIRADDRPLNSARLTPLPIYGIPGWHTEQDAAFYADARYFRPLKISDSNPG